MRRARIVAQREPVPPRSNAASAAGRTCEFAVIADALTRSRSVQPIERTIGRPTTLDKPTAPVGIPR
jgi:hypothetical protein